MTGNSYGNTYSINNTFNSNIPSFNRSTSNNSANVYKLVRSPDLRRSSSVSPNNRLVSKNNKKDYVIDNRSNSSLPFNQFKSALGPSKTSSFRLDRRNIPNAPLQSKVNHNIPARIRRSSRIGSRKIDRRNDSNCRLDRRKSAAKNAATGYNHPSCPNFSTSTTVVAKRIISKYRINNRLPNNSESLRQTFRKHSAGSHHFLRKSFKSRFTRNNAYSHVLGDDKFSSAAAGQYASGTGLLNRHQYRLNKQTNYAVGGNYQRRSQSLFRLIRRANYVNNIRISGSWKTQTRFRLRRFSSDEGRIAKFANQNVHGNYAGRSSIAGRIVSKYKLIAQKSGSNRKYGLAISNNSNFSNARLDNEGRLALDVGLKKPILKTGLTKHLFRKRNRGVCLFYCRYGRCNREASCRFEHDPSKIAVCKRFLRGSCDLSKCQFSHQLDPDKMPVCAFFAKGRCSSANCPYLHVKHGKDTPVCREFLRGHCPRGVKCSKNHIYPLTKKKKFNPIKSCADPPKIAPHSRQTGSANDQSTSSASHFDLPDFIPLRSMEDDNLGSDGENLYEPPLRLIPSFIKLPTM